VDPASLPVDDSEFLKTKVECSVRQPHRRGLSYEPGVHCTLPNGNQSVLQVVLHRPAFGNVPELMLPGGSCEDIYQCGDFGAKFDHKKRDMVGPDGQTLYLTDAPWYEFIITEVFEGVRGIKHMVFVPYTSDRVFNFSMNVESTDINLDEDWYQQCVHTDSRPQPKSVYTSDFDVVPDMARLQDLAFRSAWDLAPNGALNVGTFKVHLWPNIADMFFGDEWGKQDDFNRYLGNPSRRHYAFRYEGEQRFAGGQEYDSCAFVYQLLNGPLNSTIPNQTAYLLIGSLTLERGFRREVGNSVKRTYLEKKTQLPMGC